VLEESHLPSREAKEQQQEPSGDRQPDRATRKFRFLDDVELTHLPDPEWLIEGVLPLDSLAVLFGLPAAFKSFLAADWSLCVATGTAWAGRTVRKGTTVYVAAEGASGYKVRFQSWKDSKFFEGRAGVYVLPRAVQLHDDSEVSEFVSSMREDGISPALVVFDTLSRCFVGAEENSAASMSRLVDAAEKIRRATGAAVLLVHHANKGGESERGSIALRAAIDVLMVANRDTRDPNRMSLRCKKMKDASEFEPMHFRFVPTAGSGVLTLTGAPKGTTTTSSSSSNKRMQSALNALAPTGLKHGEWKRTAEALGVPQGSFGSIRTRLLECGLVKKDDAGVYWPCNGSASDSIDSINPRSGYTEIHTEAPAQGSPSKPVIG
jgi:hypothetical protein